MRASQPSPSQPPSSQAATPVRILFVCWGNICRSPMAEGIMRHLVADAGLNPHIEVDSAGASSEHTGEQPDPRTLAEADTRGVDLRDIRARRIRPEDWELFDLILVADELVESVVLRQAPDDRARAEVHRMTAFGPDADPAGEVPDPYYGGPDGFQHVYDILERACAGLLDHVRDSYPVAP
jgi:protein-tyrosine phosphatase